MAFLESERNVVGVSIHCHSSVRLAKTLLLNERNMFMVKFDNNHLSIEENVIFCADQYETEKLQEMLHLSPILATRVIWLIIGSEVSLKNIHKSIKTEINKRLFFLNSDTGVLEEVYYANSYRVANKLGYIETKKETELVWTTTKEFYSRRFDLRGLNVRMHGFPTEEPFSYFEPEVVRNAKWKKDKKGSLVADVTHEKFFGTLVETINILKQDLNFTTTTLLRKDHLIGWPIIKNGTVVGMSGMFGDLLTGDADMIIAPVEFIIERYGMMPFSYVIDTFTLALLVSAEAGNEDREFLVYFQPFLNSLWIVLLLNTAISAAATQLFHYIYSNEAKCYFSSLIIGIITKFWTIIKSYLGTAVKSQFWSSLPSARVLFFVIFFTGNLVFMSYKAALTSELSLRRKTLPFDSPEGLYYSDYR